jgi:hypothetical protein
MKDVQKMRYSELYDKVQILERNREIGKKTLEVLQLLFHMINNRKQCLRLERTEYIHAP